MPQNNRAEPESGKIDDSAPQLKKVDDEPVSKLAESAYGESFESESKSDEAPQSLLLEAYGKLPEKENSTDYKKEGDEKYVVAMLSSAEAQNKVDSLPSGRMDEWISFQARLAQSNGAESDEIREDRNVAFPEIANLLKEAKDSFTAGDSLRLKQKIVESMARSNFRQPGQVSNHDFNRARVEFDGGRFTSPGVVVQRGGVNGAGNFYEMRGRSTAGGGANYYDASTSFPSVLKANDDVDVTRLLASKSIESIENPDPGDVKGDRLVNKIRHDGADDPEFKRFKKDMDTFLARPDLSDSQKSDTLSSVEKLLYSESQTGLSSTQMRRLAEQIINQGAHPNSIDQGNYPTCNVTTAEIYMYTHHPDKVARTVADLALTGKTTTAKGTVIELDPQSLIPPKGAVQYPERENVRTHASQIYQLAEINSRYMNHNRKHGTELRFVHNGGEGGNHREYLMDYSKSPPAHVYGFGADGKPKLEAEVKKGPDGKPLLDANLNPVMTKPSQDPGFDLPKTLDVIEEFSGQSASGLGLMHYDSMPKGTGNQLYDGFKVIASSIGITVDCSDPRIKGFKDPEHLREMLSEANRENRFPLVMEVHTGLGFLRKQVLEHDGKTSDDNMIGGGHAMTITGYDPATGLIEVDNQWGDSLDKRGPSAVTAEEVQAITRIDQPTVDRIKRKKARDQKTREERLSEYSEWCKENGVKPFDRYPTTEELAAFRSEPGNSS